MKDRFSLSAAGGAAIRQIFLLTILLVGAVLLAACGKEETLPTPPPTMTTDAEAPAAAASAVSPAPSATSGVLPAPPTMAAPPTSTPLPATATPEPTATTAAIVLLSPGDFGDDRNPLTGELVSDPENLQRRPVAVKLSNSPPEYTRPQSGLNDADWVFEHTTEGNITRFTAILYGKTPPRVGPIRSARLIDVELPAMFDAALAYSGASNGVSKRINNSDFRSRILFAENDGYYRTGEDKPWEHTLYARPDGFWEGLDRREQNVPPTFNTSLAFHSEPPQGGQTAEKLTIDYKWTVVEWQYDAEIGKYRRWSDGEIHADGNTGEQATAANVIVISPLHVEDPTICEEIRNGRCAHLSIQIQIWGSGPATIFRDGQRYEATWQRINRSDLLTFVDSNGDPFPLQIGNSWVQVVPTWLSSPLSSE